MKTHGMMFRDDLIRKLRSGEKTQTRRIMKTSNSYFDGGAWPKELKRDGRWESEGWFFYNEALSGSFISAYLESKELIHQITPKIYDGDQIYVKEAFCFDEHGLPVYRVDFPEKPWKWTSPMFMPRAVARIWLDVLSVRAERLQDITDADARAEGVELPARTVTMYEGIYRDAFARLWDSIHGAGAWDKNPWVWVYEFKESQNV